MSDSSVAGGGSSCQIPTTFLVENATTSYGNIDPFETTGVIQWMHEQSPRFGHPRDLTFLLQGTAEEQTQYKRGLLATSYVLICIFVIWSCLLLLLKYLGPTQVGIFSGASPTVAQTPPCRKKFYRGIFLFSGLAIIISSILMSIYGVDSLTDTLDSGRDGINIARDLIQLGVGLLDEIIQQNSEIGTEVDIFLNDITYICPNFEEAFALCNLTSTEGNDLSDPQCFLSGVLEPSNIDVLQSVLDHFANDEDSTYYQELVDLRGNLQHLVYQTESADDTASSINWALYCAMGFSIALSVICLIMIIGEVFRLSMVLQKLRSWFVMPIFILAVTCSLLFSSIFVIWSMALADLCVDSPDAALLSIMGKFEDDLSPILVESATFYISHCPEDQIPGELTAILQSVAEAVPYIDQFLSFLDTNTDFIQLVCGLEDPARVAQLTTVINSQICDIFEILNRIRLYFQCENWYPLYETVMYDAVCYNGSSGFAWIVATQFIIVIMAMVLLTFRGILYDDDVLISKKEIENIDGEEKSDNSSEPTIDNISPSKTGDDGFEVSIY